MSSEEVAKRRAEYYLQNKEKINTQQRKYYLKNKEEINRKSREYGQEHKEQIKKQQKEFKENNPEFVKERQRRYDKKRKRKPTKKSLQYKKEYNVKYRYLNKDRINRQSVERRKNDPLQHLMSTLRSRVYDALKRNGYKKTSKTYEILGASFEKVKQYIEQQFTKGMSWELVGPRIHIDHIMPLASATNKEELIKLCHYTNLQPLWAEDNMKKGSKILN